MTVDTVFCWARSVATRPGRFAAGLGAVVAALAMAGCSASVPPPEFRLNLQDMVLDDIVAPDAFTLTGGKDDAAEKKANLDKLKFLSTALYAAFGTPNEPFLFKEAQWDPEEKKGLDLKKVQLAAGPFGGTQDGKQRGLFRQHCAHCHGVTGDGAGPTAAFLNPYPRDYRRGIFKFKSTATNARPTTADLTHILHEGIPGTAMPSFLLLPSDEIESLVEYVKYLSIRGETERALAIALFAEDEDIPEEAEAKEFIAGYVSQVIDDWKAAEEAVINPEPPPSFSTPEEKRASIARGRELFFFKDAQCTKCHGPTALGDGNDGGPEQLFDRWNEKKKPENVAFWVLPKQELRPRNLRQGIYRGGRRPLDLYRRIYAGIPGGPMPAAGPSSNNPKGTLKSEDIWHLVNYVRSLPFEEGSEPAQYEHVAAAAPTDAVGEHTGHVEHD